MPRIDTRMYTNLVLTVIAVVLLASTAQQYGVPFLPSAQAQLRTTRDDISRTATGVAIDTTIPQTQDVAVAAATTDVAASNREIAVALKEIAAALRDGMRDINSGLSHVSRPVSTSSSPAPVISGEKPTVEVSR